MAVRRSSKTYRYPPSYKHSSAAHVYNRATESSDGHHVRKAALREPTHHIYRGDLPLPRPSWRPSLVGANGVLASARGVRRLPGGRAPFGNSVRTCAWEENTDPPQKRACARRGMRKLKKRVTGFECIARREKQWRTITRGDGSVCLVRLPRGPFCPERHPNVDGVSF